VVIVLDIDYRVRGLCWCWH